MESELARLTLYYQIYKKNKHLATYTDRHHKHLQSIFRYIVNMSLVLIIES